MRVWIAAFAAGLLFSFGLAVARMIDPARVIGFLDIAGAWDPTLAFVMGAAVIVSGAGFALIRRKLSRPWFADRFHLPTRTEIDAPLIIGAILFGVGWGLAGLCPGPAIALLSLVPDLVWPFVAAMLAGTALHRLTASIAARRARRW